MPSELAVLGDLARAGLAAAREWAGAGSLGDAFLDEVVAVTWRRQGGGPAPPAAWRDRGAALRVWTAGEIRLASADGPPGPAMVACLRQLDVPAVRGAAAVSVTAGLAAPEQRPLPRVDGPEADFLAGLEQDLARRLPGLAWELDLEDRARVALTLPDDGPPRLTPFRWLRLQVAGRGEGGRARWSGGAPDLATLARTITGESLAAPLARRWQGSRTGTPARCGPATPVVLGAGNGALLLHEMAHTLEADALPGETVEVWSRLLTIWDDPARPGMRGSFRHDDEGRAAGRRLLVRQGRVAGRLGDRRHAGGAAGEGHGRRASRHHPPRPRAGNLCLAAGESSTAGLAGGREPVLWIHDIEAAAVDARSGHLWLRVSDGEWLHDGRPQAPVAGLLLEGDLATVLAAVDRVGRERAADSGGLTCSRDGEGVPIGLLAPAFRTRGLRQPAAGEPEP
jgi:predicted Zn-dependent protease